MDEEWHPRQGEFPPVKKGSSGFVSALSSGNFEDAVLSFCKKDVFACPTKGTFFHVMVEQACKKESVSKDAVFSLMTLMKKNGVDVDARDINHDSPIMKLVRSGKRMRDDVRKTMLSSLLSVGGSADAFDDGGMTPSMVCVQLGLSEELDMLLSSGGSVNVRTRETSRGLPFFVPVKESSPFGKTKMETRSVFDVLRSHSCDFGQDDYEGQKVAHMLAKRGAFVHDSFIVEKFIEADNESRDVFGMSAFDLASLSGNVEWLSIWEMVVLKRKSSGASTSRGAL